MSSQMDQPQTGLADALPESARTARLSRSLAGRRLGDYVVLMKPEITFLVTLSALAGFIVGSPGTVDGIALGIMLVGVSFCSAGAGALNHYLERDRDLEMKRTVNRPLPAGRIPALHARNLGLLLSAAGLGILCPLINPLTAVLAALSIGLYLFVYTPMKSKTWWNTLVGTIPGALPAIGGYAAATNSLSAWSAWLVFGILLCWQMPHFLALAWMYRKDYGRGGFAMLPVFDGSGTSTAALALAFCLGTVGLSLLLARESAMGPAYVATAVVGGMYFLRPAVRFWTTRANSDARRLLKASVMYIPLLVLSIVLDRLI
jgi:protoheme IX farnesyltransferase